ncbi:MAG TPA: hypothetical protein VGA81_06295, partial [Methylomirabilota bacterium]
GDGRLGGGRVSGGAGPRGGRRADVASPGGRDAMTQGKRDKQFYEQRASDEMARHFLSADYDTRRSAKTRATR